MTKLSILIIVLLILIIIALLLNQRFDFTGRFKESRRLQKTYDSIHEKYKKLLDE